MRLPAAGVVVGSERMPWRPRPVRFMLAAVCLACICGCGRSGPSEPSDPSQRPVVVSAAMRDKLLEGAMLVLGRLDDYDEASAFAQVFDRLNQWSHGNPAADAAVGGGWMPDPLLDGLPERLRSLAATAALESAVFDASSDVMALRDQRWLADIAAAARGDAIDDLAIATNLFQWTVRSLAIVTDPPMVPTDGVPGTRWFLPGEILLTGRASAAQRSWMFLQILRHAGLDGVMLATGPAEAPRPWIPAVISGGEAYLFEPTYGLPIPGPGGVGIATVRQAASDPAILRALSVGDRRYPVQAADLANLVALVAADPTTLSRRMWLLDARMAGSRALSLSVDASAIAARARAALPEIAAASPEGSRVALWQFPWESFARRRDPAVQAAAAAELAVMGVAMERTAPGGAGQGRVVRPLYAARVREFRGDLDGPDGAKASYLAARPTAATIAAATAPLPPQQADAVRRLYDQMKEDATYWLGVLTLAEGDDEAAVDYLDRMMLKAAPDSRWTDAARINLAAALVALGRTSEAIPLLEADTSPQRYGSRIRAARLASAAASRGASD